MIDDQGVIGYPEPYRTPPCDQPERQSRVAVHRHLRPIVLRRLVKLVATVQDVADWIRVASIERQVHIAQHILRLAAKTLLEDQAQLLHVQLENPGQQAKREKILPLLAIRAAQRLNRVRRKQHSAFLQAADMVLVAMLVKCQ